MPGTTITRTPNPSTFIQFTESDHKYVLQDKNKSPIKNLISVTTLISRYFPEFDADELAPRVALKRGISVDAVKDEWKAIAAEASRYGTRVHEFLEDIIQGRKARNIPENEKEEKVFSYAAAFSRKFKERFVQAQSEKVICDPTIGIAGTIDMLCKDPKDDSWVIMDWKTNKQIRMNSQYSKFGFDPISHIEDCEFGHYSLQLNFYEYILKHAGYISPNETVSKYLIHFHPELGVNILKVPNLQREVLAIINDYVEEINAGN